ncbi:hypothetical protein LQ772_06585 [Frateuria edaphi]|uniref:hypothetical protein n=1 Tax=Frateuria edaphi TaxID=2898793 RepID=UPI001E2AEC6A|nr:hypothetical protein [Frateuria edaphi]UGB46952.1 hypothetical protein LQ772_06585 [Frateuria edaphi]
MSVSRRSPARRDGFCWARIPQSNGTVLYRLYRRDQRNAVHAVLRNFPGDAARHDIARELKAARHQLRNTVDEIDLVLLGVTA